MTDEDDALFSALTNACDTFCLSLAENRLSREGHIEVALMFIDMAERVLKRMVDNPQVTEDDIT